MTLPSPSRPKFEPDSVPAAAPAGSPIQASLGALVRFEFEAGRGNEGTKILMVEWEDDDNGSGGSDWEVSWEGKTTLLSARDGAEDRLHRIYFLLAPGISIPPVVKLARKSSGANAGTGKSTDKGTGAGALADSDAHAALEMKPLPAIFPAELGLRGTAAGKRGILHTRYAKQRLAALQEEIEREMRTNGEGIGLEIAMQEKQWLEDNFGVGPRPGAADPNALPYHHTHYQQQPSSPKTPGGGRLAERLRGLKLGTSASELSGSPGDHEPSKYSSSSHPLSPDTGDVAVSSFSLFHGAAPPRRTVAQNPPDHLQKSTGNAASSRIASLDEELAVSSSSPAAATTAAAASAPSKDDEEELFAVKLSPRSPDMTKSPFSFTAKETAP